MSSNNFNSYQSVFSWRYGSSEMRKLFSLEQRFKTWRKIWTSIAKAEYKAGILTKDEFADILKNQNNISIEEIFEIEKSTKHDVVAALKEFSSKAKKGGGKIHLGATSMDIVDNGDTLIIKEGLGIIKEKVIKLLKEFAVLISKYSKVSCIGFTHLQPAEPTTVGYRLSFYAQDLLIDLDFLNYIQKILLGKGIKGAVGTSASFSRILDGTKYSSIKLEEMIMSDLDLKPFLISSQISTRKLDYLVLTCLNSISSSVAKFAEDLRILQSPQIGEWSEPFSKTQVGSSAMPFKRNPVNSEKICSLARYVAQLPNVMLSNAQLSHLERTLDDSANRRIVIPETFLATDEILISALKIVPDMVINRRKIEANLNSYAPFSATEIIIVEAVKKGADRQRVHEEIRNLSMKAWERIEKGEENSLPKLLEENKYIARYLKKEEINKYMNIKNHTGDASIRALVLVKEIKRKIK